MCRGWNSVSLDSLGVLRARGADVVSFLQGQLSNDVALLGPGRSLLAGYHNPQGRVIALLHLVQASADEVLAILPRELTAAVASRLAKFILRAKVQLAEESPLWQLTGLVAPESPADPAPAFAGALPGALNDSARLGVRPAGHRHEPVHQQQQPRRQCESGEAVQDGSRQGVLELVHRQVRR